MTNSVTQLDVMTLPLHGERLIEASAGTGKTFTIAGLYLRLLLGHGDKGHHHGELLTVDKILVVTFTEAATGELRDRIRRRIIQARNAFLAGNSDDPIIAPLLAASSDHRLSAQTLLQALRQMDEAAIFTIHGFCQRMLKQHAFESGSYFETEFVTDESTLRLQAIEDFWRQHFYGTSEPLDLTVATLVKSYWPEPSALLRDISGYLTNPYLVITANGQDDELHQYLAQQIASIDQLKKAWLEQFDQIEAEIVSKKIDKRSYSSRNLPKWLNDVSQWAQTTSDDLQVSDYLVRFSSSSLSEKTKDGPVPSLDIFNKIEQFLQQSFGIKDTILAQAISFVRGNVCRAKQQESLLSFDDLLSGLSNALDNQRDSVLALRIRTQYPLAMIDEFQDTDMMQYQIFNTIYGGQTSAGLLMIGDPKQAIYGFRGADIFTYIGARRQVSAHYTLGTNWRSSGDMVTAVNAIFEQHQAPFIYQDDIAFHPVKDSGKQTKLMIDGDDRGAISQWLIASDSTVNKADYQQQMAFACANQVNELLSKGSTGDALIKDFNVKDADGNVSDPERGVIASDIAILVRTGSEARLIKQQLERQGISSVYLSNRDSVFNAVVAQDIWRILLACLEPTNARLLRGALASALLDYNAHQLDAINNNEQKWQQAVNDFTNFAQRWQKIGVLAMLREFIDHYQIAARLLSQPSGERQLTDLLHLGEVLQQQSLEIEGEHALVHWLSDKVNNPAQDDQEQQLRLESDQHLVQIVTIHKSKGLEYNLVFLPFICSFRKETRAVYHQDQQTIVDLTLAKESLEKADLERLAEDLRLFYVAITRAVCHCWLGLAPLKSGRATKEAKTDLHQSAIGYLLLGGAVTTSEQLTKKLHALSAEFPMIKTLSPPAQSLSVYQASDANGEIGQARKFRGVIEHNYWITSYSALSKSHHSSDSSTIDASVEQFNIDWEAGVDSLTNQTEEVLEPQEASIFTFPRGANAGTFLHTLFEEIDFPNASGAYLETKISELLSHSEYDESWLAVLMKLVADVLDMPLSDNMSLRDLTMANKLVEMEFFMPLSPFNCEALNQILIKHDPLSKQAPPLTFGTVQGMLKGFIDLVFVVDGRYYVADYKSNHLGDHIEDYNQERLSEVMVDHRYDFQYQIYSLALHRLLKTRLPDYDFEQHFGGVYYLFLRGMTAVVAADDELDLSPENANYGVFYNRPSQVFIEQLDTLFAAGAAQ
ncbi:MAG: exodeoxyribonuclease V subunit beta [Gammaproteobacteria bacterium]|nr:exodeoxyribonuclease V subunit beta [Gammaproteobacteria bacterium]